MHLREDDNLTEVGRKVMKARKMKHVDIHFLFKSHQNDEQPQKRRGRRARPGKLAKVVTMRRVGGLLAHYADCDFVAVVDEGLWDELSAKDREAAVCEALARVRKDGETHYLSDRALSVLDPYTLKEYGPWRKELEAAHKTLQKRLPYDEAA